MNWIEKYSHNIAKSFVKIEKHLPDGFVAKYKPCFQVLSELPIGLRYRFDAWDFHDNQEQLYAQTIASQAWMELVLSGLEELIEIANTELGKHTRIVHASELHKEIFEPTYRRYAEQSKKT